MAKHKHAELIMQYAQDAQETDKPWERWELRDYDGRWYASIGELSFFSHNEYRRKCKTKIVNGIEIPNITFKPEYEGSYYFPVTHHPNFHSQTQWGGDRCIDRHIHDVVNGCYPYTEEGKQAAILHARALLGIAE